MGKNLNESSYRSDVDGLRAVAVSLVIFYHLGFGLFPGGFIGVDIFFVISGFIITRLILRDAENQNFSLLDFYARRFRRILPALISVITFTLAFGYWFLFPDDYLDLAKSAVFSAFSIPNLFFFWNTGYFDQDAELMPLLHLWSLGIEEQFYLVWPGLILLLARRSPSALTYILIILIGASFSASVLELGSDPKAAFFLPHFRVWELSLGALIAVLPIRLSSKLSAITISSLGLVLIIAPALLLSSTSKFPGFAAIAPTVGTALVIISGNKNRHGLNIVLSTRPFVLVGLLSYSLYLWHWPVIVFWRHYFNGRNFTPTEGGVILVITCILAFISWRWIETPVRMGRLSRKNSFAFGFSGLLTLVILGTSIIISQGVKSRFSSQVGQLLSRHEMWWKWKCPYSDTGPTVETFLGRAECVFGEQWDGSQRKAVLWGNSHAEHLTPIFEVAAKETGTSVALWPASCLPFVSKDGIRMMWNGDPILMSERCGLARDKFIEKLDAHPEISRVILSANWAAADGRLFRTNPDERFSISMDLLREGLQDLVNRVTKPGRKIIILGDIPYNGLDLRACFLAESAPLFRARCPEGDKILRSQFERYNKSADEAISSIKGAEVVLLGERMCGEVYCDSQINGESLYRDNDHWRRNLSSKTAEALSERLRFRDLLL